MRVVRKRACIFWHGIPEVSNTRCEQVESASNERFSRFCMVLLVEGGMAKSVAEKLSHEKKKLCHARHVRRTCLKEVAGLVRYEIPRRLQCVVSMSYMQVRTRLVVALTREAPVELRLIPAPVYEENMEE
jgi:hypothetical protein